MTTEESESLRDAKAKAYEVVAGALSQISDSCDQPFYDMKGIKKLAEAKLKQMRSAFAEHLRKFPD